MPHAKLPKTRDEIELTGAYTKTLNGQDFLLIDSKNKDRIVAFASKSSLEILARHQSWHADGTFKSGSKHYYQNVSVNIQYKNIECKNICSSSYMPGLVIQ